MTVDGPAWRGWLLFPIPPAGAGPVEQDHV